MSTIKTITVPSGTKYLSELFNMNTEYGDTLPTNCLFDKRLTGVGGTYIALSNPYPTIIVVPTRALVKDKAEQERYKQYNILPVSSDYPFTGIPNGCKKIICTYHSLEKLCSHLTMSNWNLVVDEMHLINRMLSFTRQPIEWVLDNYKNFKSYCFMSATIPETKFLPEQLQDIDRVVLDWEEAKPIKFECLHSTNVYETMLQIIGEHLDGTRPGNAYFFYNSIAGICKIINVLRKNSKFKDCYSAMVSKSAYTTERLNKVGTAPKSPTDFKEGQYRKINFVSSANFEGVDYYDKEGVTYIVSDSKYSHTKYSIITTIPQVAGRLRDSIYNDKITLIFDNYELNTISTEEELEDYIKEEERKAKTCVVTYDELMEKQRAGDDRSTPISFLIRGALHEPYIELRGINVPLEEIDHTTDVEGVTGMEIYKNAAMLDRELYHLLRTNIYVLGKDNGEHISSLIDTEVQRAPLLSEKYSKFFVTKSKSIQDMYKLYEDDIESFVQCFPEWLDVFNIVSYEQMRKMQFNKTVIKSYYKSSKLRQSESVEYRIRATFKLNETYPKAEIKQTLLDMGIPKAKATMLQDYFNVRSVKVGNVNSFKIISYKT